MNEIGFHIRQAGWLLGKKGLPIALMLVLASGFASGGEFREDRSQILKEFSAGHFTVAAQLISRALLRQGLTKEEADWLVRQRATMERIRLDFGLTREQVRKQLERFFPGLQDHQIVAWEKSGHLEMRLIDDAPRYFNHAVANLFRLDAAAAAARRKRNGVPAADPLDAIRLENTGAILNAGKSGALAEGKKIAIEFTLTVDADAVPAGEDICCWLPFPRESPPRQKHVVLLAAVPADAIRSPQECLHSSLHAVQKAVKGVPTVFSYRASFEIWGQWFDPQQIVSKGNDAGEGVGPFLKEEPPHVVFSPAVRKLAESLCAGETNPLKIVRKFYLWIDGHIPWASALEYSIIDCIPDYVISRGHGDCGMQTFLLMSLARCQGIPARWQSGWMLHPGQENLHDWCEFRYPGTGWVPVDMSFGLQNSKETAVKDFYLTGIDSYRMIVNDGFAQEFCPPKKHYRSEPFDFQRGEVEWAKGNIYFDKWGYQLHVLAIEKIDK
ncbi:MAG: transglutaminase-like domain-containing protein [Candidatus Aminicenantes bacterium]|nr:transglutaminase-like domain-containing protein [Candidatus Aminicenantes bacterium]